MEGAGKRTRGENVRANYSTTTVFEEFLSALVRLTYTHTHIYIHISITYMRVYVDGVLRRYIYISDGCKQYTLAFAFPPGAEAVESPGDWTLAPE